MVSKHAKFIINMPPSKMSYVQERSILIVNANCQKKCLNETKSPQCEKYWHSTYFRKNLPKIRSTLIVDSCIQN